MVTESAARKAKRATDHTDNTDLRFLLPNSRRVKVPKNGAFKVVLTGLNQPTSLEFIGNTAFVVTNGGEIWRIDGLDSCRRITADSV